MSLTAPEREGGASIPKNECYEGYHGPDEAEDGVCPFCNRPMRTVGDAEDICAMCGMEVHHPDEGASIEGSHGRTLHFCSIWCLRVYQREVARDAHAYVEEASRLAMARRDGKG